MKDRLWRGAGAALASGYALHYALTYRDWHFIDTVNLIFHEAGHTIFFFFGEFFQIFMGSGFQILLPLIIAFYFFYVREERLSAAVCLMWAGMSLLNVSIYAGDALAMQLPLLGGDSVTHDWNYLLLHMNLLRHTAQIAGLIFAIGMLAICLGVALAFYYALSESPATEINQF